MTGFYRTGSCHIGTEDIGIQAICIEATDDFLLFSKHAGNDLSTPNPLFDFPGLNAGDRWCLCAARWQEAFQAGVAPPVLLEATHETALQYAKLADLKRHALDVDFNDLLDDLGKSNRTI